MLQSSTRFPRRLGAGLRRMRAQMSRITRESTTGRIIKCLGVEREGMTGQGEEPSRASLVETWET